MREAPEGEEADGDSEGDAPEAPDSVPAANIILGATSEVRRAFTAKTMAKARPLEHPILSKKQDTARPQSDKAVLYKRVFNMKSEPDKENSKH